MIIVPGRPDQPTEQRDRTFTGVVYADAVLPSADGTAVNTVYFTPGARTYWHQHERGQVLHVLAGGGLIGVDGEQPRELRQGDVVWSPPGERHWHGAGPGTFLAHLAVSLGPTSWSSEVSEADYGAAAQGEAQS
jgi:quercetin dioxygenase-like cupin family protein